MYRTFQASLLSPKAGRLCQTAAVCSRSKTTASTYQIDILKKVKIYETMKRTSYLIFFTSAGGQQCHDQSGVCK